MSNTAATVLVLALPAAEIPISIGLALWLLFSEWETKGLTMLRRGGFVVAALAVVLSSVSQITLHALANPNLATDLALTISSTVLDFLGDLFLLLAMVSSWSDVTSHGLKYAQIRIVFPAATLGLISTGLLVTALVTRGLASSRGPIVSGRLSLDQGFDIGFQVSWLLTATILLAGLLRTISSRPRRWDFTVQPGADSISKKWTLFSVAAFETYAILKCLHALLRTFLPISQGYVGAAIALRVMTIVLRALVYFSMASTGKPAWISWVFLPDQILDHFLTGDFDWWPPTTGEPEESELDSFSGAS